MSHTKRSSITYTPHTFLLFRTNEPRQPYRTFFPTLTSLVGAFPGLDNAIVEDHLSLVTYDAVAGGAVKKTQDNHLRNQSELVLVVHRPCPPDKSFACNRCVVADVSGHSTGRYPHAKQILALESLPVGAPNGGSRSFFPGKVACFWIGRYILEWYQLVDSVAMGRLLNSSVAQNVFACMTRAVAAAE